MHVKNKIIILDEVHKLSKTSQEALLKEVEAERTNLYFFFCTTETSGMLETLKDRATGQFIFKALTTDQKVDLFVGILNNEKFEAKTEDVLKILENVGDSARQVIAAAQNFISGNLTILQEDKFETDIKSLSTMIIKGDWKFLEYYAKNVQKQKDISHEKIRLSVAGYLKGCLLRADNNYERFSTALGIMTDPYYGPDIENRLIANMSKACSIFSKAK
jgi:DNA polymerase III gamma/tau subunit